MPTNILRAQSKRRGLGPDAAALDAAGPREVLVTAGRARIRVALLATPTADRVWAALPLHATAETWGGTIHFKTPIETGRERTAHLLVSPGDVCFWSEADRIVLAFGPTPLSRVGEIRLQRPCNVWGKALDDVGALARVTPGEKVSVVRAASR